MVCRDTPLWMDPRWTTSVTYDCNRLIEMLTRLQPESLNSHAPFPHEFLPLGMSQKEFWPDPVRTPWKLTVGMNHRHLLFLRALLRVVAS